MVTTTLSEKRDAMRLSSASAFASEFEFDRAWHDHADSHPAIREAACLAAQFPGAMLPLEPGDLFAGRYYATPGVGKPVRDHRGYKHPWKALEYNMPSLGFAALRPGWGTSPVWFFDEGILRRKMEEANPDEGTRARLEDLIARWRPIEPMKRCREAMPESFAKALPFDKLDSDDEAHPAYPLIRMTGPMLDFDALLCGGIPGLRARLSERLKQEEQGSDAWNLLTGMGMGLDVLANVCRFYAAQAMEQAEDMGGADRAARLELARVLGRLPDHAPASLHEAMQSVLLYSTIATAYSFGRMDDYLGDFLARDLDAGRLTEAQALELLKSFWSIVADCGAPFDNRIIVGGVGRRNPANADRFARLAIEATRQVKEPLPQLSLRFGKDSAPDLYERAMVAISEGRTFPMLYKDEVNIPAVQNAMGVSREDAEQYVPYGCGEYVIYKKSFGTPSGVINLAKVLECVLRNGHERLGNRTVGLLIARINHNLRRETPREAGWDKAGEELREGCMGSYCPNRDSSPTQSQPASRKSQQMACDLSGLGGLEDFKSFDDLWKAYTANVEYWLGHLAEQQKWEYDWAGRQGGWLFFSMLYDDCIARGKNLFSGGIRHLGGTMESYGQINAADSLLAIKKLVFDEKKISPKDLIFALDADFVDAPEVRRMLVAAPKYGNDNEEADAMQVRVHEHVCHTTRNLASKVGLDSYLVVVINNMMNTVLGRHTLASADGRRQGAPLANANNPSPGSDQSGVTAFLNSLVKLDPSIHAGSVQNMKFGKEMFSRALRPKLDALLGTYWKQGGPQSMITVVSRGDLEAALKEPEKYVNLMVRVGGFSARFVDLPKDVQMEIFNRTLN